MKLLKATIRGDVGYINADYVMAISIIDGRCRILLNTEDDTEVEESIEEILEQLKD